MMLTLTVNVEQKHIDAAEFDNCWRNPLALAIYDAWAQVDLESVDELYKYFDVDFPYSVSVYTDKVILWTEDVYRDLLLAWADTPESVQWDNTQPYTCELEFVIVEDEDLE